MRGEHVHLVDEVHLAAAACRRVLHVVEQFTRVVHLGARSGVDLEQVDEPAGVDVPAGAALAAGLRRDAPLAVERLGEDAGDGRLADAAGARKQERVMDAARVERVGEGATHVVLADELVEAARAPLAGEDEVTHGRRLDIRGRGSREAARARIPPAPGVTAAAAPFRA